MAAGLGFKDFVTGEVLTAADVDGYLMQGIWVFASNAARDAAVTSPQEGNFAFTKDTNSLWYYDGAAWVASGATGDIEGVTAGIGISGGGTSGTVTVTNSMATAIDAKGDLVVGTGADTFAKLTVGANGTILTADSAEATGLKWATPASGATFSGCVLIKSGNQTITASSYQAITFTTESIDTNGYHDNSTNTSRITIPSGKGGKYLVIANFTYGNFNTAKYLSIFKNGAQIDCLIAWQANSLTTTPYSMSGIVDLVATDYLEVMAYSDIQSTTSNHTFAVSLLGA